MKKVLLYITVVGLLVACNSDTSSTDTIVAVEGETMDPNIEKGMNLVAKSDCFTCHKVVETSIGPSYEAIAVKYKDTKANTLSLAQKIIKGGSGNWGPVPMTPHPDISPDDAHLMANYILSLK